jgi:hypothetical protein
MVGGSMPAAVVAWIGWCREASRERPRSREVGGGGSTDVGGGVLTVGVVRLKRIYNF